MAVPPLLQDTQDLGARPLVHDAQRSEDRERLAIIAVLALFLVFACTILSFILPEAKLLGGLSDWCDSSECRRYASLLTDGLNRSIDACDDFDAYVCSTWQPNPLFAPFLDVAIDDLSIRWLDDLEKLLREGVFHMSVAEKPLAMYRDCVGNGRPSEEDRELFRRFLKERGLSWPQAPTGNTSASSIIVDLALHWEMSLWLRVRVLKHPFSPGGRRFLLLPGRKSDTRLFIAMHENVMNTIGYSRYWHLIYFFVMGRRPSHDVSHEIKRSAQVQGTSVATLHQIMDMSYYVTPSIFRTSNNSEDVWNGTGVYWVNNLDKHLSPLQPLSPLDDVLIANTQLLKVMRRLIEERGDKEAITHISWQVVQMYAAMLDKTLLEDILENEPQSSSLHALLCAREVDAVYNPLLTALYVRSRLTPTGRTQVSALLQTLVQAAVDEVHQLSWLDLEGRQFFAGRLESTAVRLWPPHVFEDDGKANDMYIQCPRHETSFMRLWMAVRECLSGLLAGDNREYVSLTLPNFTPYLSAYDSFEPSAELAVAALANPVYWTHGTPGMLFGGLGSLFAVTYLHALNGQKHLVHPNGSVQESGSWLSSASTKALVEKQECVQPAVPSAIAGLKIAHSIFVERLQNSFHRNLSTELTDEKVFFMTFCRTLCSTHRPLRPQENCNVIVKHIGAFATAFKCSSNSPLTPRRECDFFSSVTTSDIALDQTTFAG
ncbi:hypothetical protein MTO96_004575 [Rhipicephalus appendiculatus]